MSEYSSYFLYRKYQVLNGELIDLGITSVDGDGTMPLVIRNECDSNCGCQTEPIYRWVTVSGGYECSGTTKMAQEKEQVSNDNGETWSDVSPLVTRPALPVIKYNSEDCGYIPPTPECKCSAYTYSFTSATVSSAATSITLSYTGCSKLDLASAATYNWIAIGGQYYNSGTSVGNIIANISANTSTSRSAAFYLFLDGTGCNTIYISQQSGATPTSPKYVLTLSDSSTVSAECDSTSALTRDEISAYSASVTSAVIGNCVNDIGYRTFSYCESLSSITISNSVTSIGRYVFDYCTGLTSITIPDSVTSFDEGTFHSCENLTSCTLSSGITVINKKLFQNCISLSSVTIPNSVTSIGESAFQNCWGLTSVAIPNSITNIGNTAFESCNSLASVIIPTGVTSINYGVFAHCTSLSSVTIPSSVTSIGGSVFRECSTLTSVEIPSGVTSIDTYAFENCSGLTSIMLLSTTPPSLGDMVFDNTNNCPIYVPCESVEAYKASSTWSTYASRIEGIPPCGQPTPTIDGKFKLTLNDSSTVTAECDSTSAITRNETSAYSASVASAVIGDCVSGISSYAFENCTGLTSVTMTNSVTSVGNYAFNGCYSMTSITLSNEITSMGAAAFKNCNDLEYIDWPRSIRSIPTECFKNCISLRDIGTYIGNVGYGAFENCYNLREIEIRGGVNIYIGDSAFRGCYRVTSIYIPDGVTSIGGYAFYGCDNLTSITIDSATPPSLGDNAFDDTNNCPIYVPSASVNDYKTASVWSSYASRIQAKP